MCGTAEVTSSARRFHLGMIDGDDLVRFSSQRVVQPPRCSQPLGRFPVGYRQVSNGKLHIQASYMSEVSGILKTCPLGS